MEGKVTELTSYGPDKEPCETLSKHIYVFITSTLLLRNFGRLGAWGRRGGRATVSLGPRRTDFVFKIFNLTVVREQGFPIVLY